MTSTGPHISDPVISSFCSGALSAEDTIMCAEHLEACPECNLRFKNISRPNQYYRTIILDFSPRTYLVNEHLDYEQQSRYLDGNLDDDEAEIVNIHIELCPDCRKNLSSLEEFRKVVEPELPLRYGPRNLLQRLAEFLRRFRHSRPLLAYSTLATLIILGCLTPIIYSKLGHKSPGDAAVFPGKPPLSAQAQPPNREGKIQPPPLRVEVNIEDRKRRSGDPARRMRKGVYDGGRWYGLDHRGGPLGLQALPSGIRDDVAALLRGQDLSTPALLNELMSPDVSERGIVESKERMILLSPVSTLIAEDRPLFKWKSVIGADSYIVKIVDDSFNLIAESPTLTTTEWRIVYPVERDRIYVWQVIAFKGGEIIEDRATQTGRFKIASEAKLDEIEKARRRYASRLVRGVFYVKEGLLDDAEREFRELLKRNPKSELAQSLFRKIQSRSDMHQ